MRICSQYTDHPRLSAPLDADLFSHFRCFIDFRFFSAGENLRAGATSAILVLLMAGLGGLFGHAWLGHGLYKLALLGIPFAYGARVSRPTLPGSRSLAIAASSGLVIGAAALGLLHLIPPAIADPAGIRANLDARYGYTLATVILASLLISTANALLEEWFYRGFLNRALGAPAASFVFGLQHTAVLAGIAGIGPALLAGIAVVPAGLFWSAISPRGEITLPFVSHVFTDLVLLGGGLFLLGYV